MQFFALSMSLHFAFPLEQYTPGNSSGAGIAACGGLCITNIAPAMLPAILPVSWLEVSAGLPCGDILFSSINFWFLPIAQALATCTGHCMHLHLLMVLLFKGTFFRLNKLKILASTIAAATVGVK